MAAENLPDSITVTATVDGIVKRLDIRGMDATNGGSLHGLTFAVKDMFDVKGETAGFGSPDWKASHAPSSANAPCIDALLAAGGHLLANTICDELAFSLDGINIHYGTPINPRAPERIPGGSSSGPGSVVAQGLVDFALGTDTAGSTRVPASYLGIWGLRPTYGSISLSGVLPLGPSFDTVGLLGRSLDVLTRAARVLIAEKSSSRAKNLILVEECFQLLDQNLAPPVMAAAASLKAHFASTRQTSVIDEKDGLAALVKNFATIRAYEAWHCHGHWYESQKPNLSAAVAGRLVACRGTSEEAVEKSRQYRRALQVKFGELLDQTVLCLPTTAQLPPLKTASAAELERNRSLNLQLNSIGSFLGLPQLTMPLVEGRLAGQPGPAPGLSPGLSLIGAEGSESLLLRLAAELAS